MSNINEVRYIHSNEDIHEIKSNITSYARDTNALEEIIKGIRKIDKRVTRIEIDIKNNQDTKKIEHCSDFVRNTLNKI